MKNASKAEPLHRSWCQSNERYGNEFRQLGRSTRTCTSNHRPEATLTDPVHPSATSSTITPVLVADMRAEDERMPVYVHVIDHPDARVLVDTGITELHPLVDDLDLRLMSLDEQKLDLA